MACRASLTSLTRAFAVLAAVLFAPSVARAQDRDAVALRALIDFARGELARGTRADNPAVALAARENQAHIERMLGLVNANREALRARGVDADVAAAALVYSDLGKNAEYLEAHASRVFPALYANEATRGLAKFKAFLLHEEPGMDLVRSKGKELGLSDAKIEAVLAGIRGHNGPATPGSWWGDNWDKLIAKEARNPLSPLLGGAYPLPTSGEGVLHTILDRLDQGGVTWTGEGWAGGPKKILNDLLAQGKSLEEAAREALGGNPAKTIPQIEALRHLRADLFELPFVRDAVRNLDVTRRLLDFIEFAPDGKSAVVNTPEGRSTVTDFDGFWRAFAKVTPAVVEGRGEGVPLDVRRRGGTTSADAEAERLRLIKGRRSTAADTTTSSPATGLNEILERRMREHATGERDKVR